MKYLALILLSVFAFSGLAWAHGQDHELTDRHVLEQIQADISEIKEVTNHDWSDSQIFIFILLISLATLDLILIPIMAVKILPHY